MRLALIIVLLAAAGCVRRDHTVPCDHVNDRAAWAQTTLTAAQYDSAMIAQGKECTAP
jgi:hypothetical protein